MVHQKRYLLIILQTYQDNETKTLTMLNGNVTPKPKHKSFRSVALTIIAIHRMKFIVRRWHTGKRIGANAIFSHQIPRLVNIN